MLRGDTRGHVHACRFARPRCHPDVGLARRPGVQLAHAALFLTGLGLLVGSVLALPLSRFQWRCGSCLGGRCCSGSTGCLAFICCSSSRCARRRLCRPILSTTCGRWAWWCWRRWSCPACAGGPARWARRCWALREQRWSSWAARAAASQVDGTAAMRWRWALRWSGAPTAGHAPGGAFATSAVGAFAAVSGLLSLACHALWEPAADLSARDLGLIVLLGLGPLGGRSSCGMRRSRAGDLRRIGLLAFLTPLLSTAVVLLTTGQALTASCSPWGADDRGCGRLGPAISPGCGPGLALRWDTWSP